MKITKTVGPNTIEEWAAADLGCVPLKSTTYHGQTAVTVITAQSIAYGEPDPALFEIPAGYVERSPSQVVAELNRRYPGASNANPPGLNHLDQVYNHHQMNLQ